jgi:hypothetical protein
MTHIKKVSMMKNSKNILKQKLPLLSNLHIIWWWIRRLAFAGVVALVVVRNDVSVFIAVAAGWMLFRCLIRVVVSLVGLCSLLLYMLIIVLILSLIIL